MTAAGLSSKAAPLNTRAGRVQPATNEGDNMAAMLFILVAFLLAPAWLWVLSRPAVGRAILSLLFLFLLTMPVRGATIAPITSLSSSLTCTAQWFAQQTQAGGSSVMSPIVSNTNTISKAILNGTGTGANQAQQVAVHVYNVSASSSSSVDLSAAVTNVVNSSTATFSAIKVILIQLLSSTTTSGNYDATNGTACSSITIDGTVSNAFLSTANGGWLSNSTSKIDIANGQGICQFGDNAGGMPISGTCKVLKITNNDAGNAANVQITLIGI